MNNNPLSHTRAVSPPRGKRSLAAALVGAGAMIGLSTVVAGATDLFLNFPGVAGESTNSRHRGEIDLKAFTTSASNTGTNTGGGGGGVGKVVCGQVTVVKSIDRASPQLLGRMFSGAYTPGPVTVTFEKTSGESLLDFYKVDLFNVQVTSVTQNDSETDIIRETVTMRATRFVYTYRPQNPTGGLGSPVTTGWDCLAGVRT
jgi:type VI secretion system secreted protein Hcp